MPPPTGGEKIPDFEVPDQNGRARRLAEFRGMQRRSVLLCAARITFVIDARGKIARVYPDVDSGDHALQVLGDLTAPLHARGTNVESPNMSGAPRAAP